MGDERTFNSQSETCPFMPFILSVLDVGEVRRNRFWNAVRQYALDGCSRRMRTSRAGWNKCKWSTMVAFLPGTWIQMITSFMGWYNTFRWKALSIHFCMPELRKPVNGYWGCDWQEREREYAPPLIRRARPVEWFISFFFFFITIILNNMHYVQEPSGKIVKGTFQEGLCGCAMVNQDL